MIIANLPSLCCLTSNSLRISHAEQVLILCKKGVRLIQLRAKGIPYSKLLFEAKESVEICRKYGALLIINDSVEIAIQSGADGVHLGRDDIAITRARNLLGESKLIGVTIHSKKEIKEDVFQIADYVGMGPYKKSLTKTELTPSLSKNDFISMIKQLMPIPVYLIGGVSFEDFSKSVSAMGNHGVAVCSSLSVKETLNTSIITQFVKESSKHDAA